MSTRPFQRIIYNIITIFSNNHPIDRLQNFFVNLIHAGCISIDGDLNKRVLHVNTISLITAFFSITIGVSLYLISNIERIVFPALLEAGGFFFVVYLNYRKIYVVAGVLAHFIQSAAVAYFGMLLGRVIDAQLMGIFLVGLPLLTFRSRTYRIICIILSCLSLFFLELNIYLHLIDPIQIPLNLHFVFRLLSIFTITFLNILLIYYYDWENNNLFSMLNDIVQKLKYQTELLEESNKSKSIFVSETTHELRVALHSVYAMCQFLPKVKDKPIDIDLITNNLLCASNQAVEIINNVLHFARIEEGRIDDLHVESFEIRNVVTSVTSMLNYLSAPKKIIISMQIGTVPFTMQNDRMRLTQILNNLLYNAIKFTSSNKTIIIKVDYNNKEWIFRVIDEGKGIQEKDLANIFNAYITDESNNSMSKGTGLGLHISKKNATLMGGNISVTSKLSFGTEFTVTLPNLPLPNQASTAKINLEESENISFNELCILLVEDNSMASLYTKKYLEGKGSKVLEAENGEQAIQLALDYRPDLIILDLHLPGSISGIDVIKFMRDKKNIEYTIPIIVVTGDGFKENEEKLKVAGAQDFLIKPIEFNNLTQSIQKLLPSIQKT